MHISRRIAALAAVAAAAGTLTSCSGPGPAPPPGSAGHAARGPVVTLRVAVYGSPGYRQGLVQHLRAAAPRHPDRGGRHRTEAGLLAGTAPAPGHRPGPGRSRGHPAGPDERGGAPVPVKPCSAEHAGRGRRRREHIPGPVAVLGLEARIPRWPGLWHRRGDGPAGAVLPAPVAGRRQPAIQPGPPGPGLVHLARFPGLRPGVQAADPEGARLHGLRDQRVRRDGQPGRPGGGVRACR